jgi:hypothetical protein
MASADNGCVKTAGLRPIAPGAALRDRPSRPQTMRFPLT